MNQNHLKKRYAILSLGVFTMLFSGILYAWSILKAPFAELYGFIPSELSLNFTLTMSCFCIGGFLASRLARRIGVRATLLGSAPLAGLGFALAALVGARGPILLYLTYALMGGLGIGMAYIVIISSVNAWFPDRKGLSSGALMMGFGLSTLLLGNLADALFDGKLGFKGTFIAIGLALLVTLTVAALFIRTPAPDAVFPEPKKKIAAKGEDFEARDFRPGEMVRRFTFWRAFLALVCLTAVGSSVISFARDLALSLDAGASLATSLVGILAVCNGLGRILTGAVFDAMGRKFTMISASALTVFAAGVTLLSVGIGSLALLIVGLCLTGLSYGTSPTVSAAFTSAFYGRKHFATNLSISNFNLMAASFVATACSALLSSSGGYTVPFLLLLALSLAALALNLTIKRP